MSDDIVTQLRSGDAYDGKTICCKYDRCNCAVMENAAAEIERLKAELEEAREIIQQQLGFPFGSAERARAFLDKAGK